MQQKKQIFVNKSKITAVYYLFLSTPFLALDEFFVFYRQARQRLVISGSSSDTTQNRTAVLSVHNSELLQPRCSHSSPHITTVNKLTPQPENDRLYTNPEVLESIDRRFVCRMLSQQSTGKSVTTVHLVVQR